MKTSSIVELKCAKKITQMSRRIQFSSAHLYRQDKWSEQKNQSEFGACFSEFGHGHNYVLEAYFAGEINPQTGLLVNLIDIEPILKTIVAEFDHKHLNFTHPHFKDLVPTTENMATFLYKKIQEALPILNISSLELVKIKLFEDQDLWVEILK
jgi:6-pyruvoyltetrahydropterin/6-carboxytetrahydropterin synthase